MLLEQLKNIPSTDSDLRKFGLTVGTVLLALGAVLWYFEKSSDIYFLGIGGAILLIGLAVPIVLKPLQKIWMAIAILVGWVMTRLILSVLFFLVFTPISLISRLFGRSFLDLRPNPSQETYWNLRERNDLDKTTLERQF
jgi:hypothetical protein